MFNYAQVSSGAVIGISELHSEVIQADLIALDENYMHQGRLVKLGDNFDGEAFTDGEQAQ